MDNEILKQNILTKTDFVGMLLDELNNSGFLDDKSEVEIELITEKSNFELIQKYCKNNIKQVVNNLSNIDDMELDEIIDFFGFDATGFVNEIK
jgi:hypothetical protein